jgi:hypothetical protein
MSVAAEQNVRPFLVRGPADVNWRLLWLRRTYGDFRRFDLRLVGAATATATPAGTDGQKRPSDEGRGGEAETMSNVRGIAIARNQAGRLELVATSLDDEESPGSVWHAWQTAPGGNWAGWASLGEPPGGASWERPAVARNVDGRLEAVVMGRDRAVWHAWQTAPGGIWAGWRSLGWPGRQPTPQVPLALMQNQDGRLEVFTLAGDSAVWHAWQTVPGEEWTGWHTLGKPSQQVRLQSTPALARNQDGRLELFAKGTDKAVWHCWQQEPGSGHWLAWSSLRSPRDHGFEGEPAVARNHDGRLELFVTETDGPQWHRWQQQAGPGPWTEWCEFNGVPHIRENPELAVGAHADGRLLLCAKAVAKERDTDVLWRTQQLTPNAGWEGWSSFADPSTYLTDLTVVSDAEGRLELFLRDLRSGGVYRVNQTTPNGEKWTSSMWSPPPHTLTELEPPAYRLRPAEDGESQPN